MEMEMTGLLIKSLCKSSVCLRGGFVVVFIFSSSRVSGFVLVHVIRLRMRSLLHGGLAGSSMASTLLSAMIRERGLGYADESSIPKAWGRNLAISTGPW